MRDTQQVIEQIRQAFRETERPGDAFLQGSQEGCEPGESVAPFMGIVDWSQLDAEILDASYTALSFFSEGGFRYFLPAYLIADVADRRSGLSSHERVFRQGREDSCGATNL